MIHALSYLVAYGDGLQQPSRGGAPAGALQHPRGPIKAILNQSSGRTVIIYHANLKAGRSDQTGTNTKSVFYETGIYFSHFKRHGMSKILQTTGRAAVLLFNQDNAEEQLYPNPPLPPSSSSRAE